MTLRTRRFWARAAIVVAILGVLGGITGWALMRFFPNRVDHYGGIVINYLRTLTAPKGTSTRSRRSPVHPNRVHYRTNLPSGIALHCAY
jgi:hypothetical protein